MTKNRERIARVEDLLERVTEEEWLILDVLRGIIKERLPNYCREKMAYSVPCFYGHRGICILWPSSIPRGGVKEGVLLGFMQGNQLKDLDGYLEKGTNKKVFYKVFKDVNDIDIRAIEKLLEEAVQLDRLKK